MYHEERSLVIRKFGLEQENRMEVPYYQPSRSDFLVVGENKSGISLQLLCCAVFVDSKYYRTLLEYVAFY
jgi:hypothetical protein